MTIEGNIKCLGNEVQKIKDYLNNEIEERLAALENAHNPVVIPKRTTANCPHIYESECHGIEMLKDPSGSEWAIGGTNHKTRWKFDPWCGGIIPNNDCTKGNCEAVKCEHDYSQGEKPYCLKCLTPLFGYRPKPTAKTQSLEEKFDNAEGSKDRNLDYAELAKIAEEHYKPIIEEQYREGRRHGISKATEELKQKFEEAKARAIRAWGLVSKKTGKALPYVSRWKMNAIVESKHYFITPEIVRVLIQPITRKKVRK